MTDTIEKVIQIHEHYPEHNVSIFKHLSLQRIFTIDSIHSPISIFICAVSYQAVDAPTDEETCDN